MKLENTTEKSLEEIMAGLTGYYPEAKIKKPFLGIGPQALILPAGNIKHILRPLKKDNKVLVADFTPPVGLVIAAVLLGLAGAIVMAVLVFNAGGRFSIGGVLWIVAMLLVLKAFYKSRNKETFDRFYDNVRSVIMGTHNPGSLF